MKNVFTNIVNVFTGKTVANRQARTGYLFVLPTFLYVVIIFFLPAGSHQCGYYARVKRNLRRL